MDKDPSSSAPGVSLRPWALSQGPLSSSRLQGKLSARGGKELPGESPSPPSFGGLSPHGLTPSLRGWQDSGPAAHSRNQTILQPSRLCLPPSLTLCIPPSCCLQSHPKSIPCTQVHISRRCSPRNQTKSACRRLWSSSRRLARELLPEPDAVLGAGAAELPAGTVLGAICTPATAPQAVQGDGLCGRSAGLWAGSPERLHRGWQRSARKRPPELTRG